MLHTCARSAAISRSMSDRGSAGSSEDAAESQAADHGPQLRRGSTSTLGQRRGHRVRERRNSFVAPTIAERLRIQRIA
jgi:hypothetical protein